MSDTEKTLSWILKGGLLLTPFLVFIVTRSLYFPFITGKNFTFRILVEILAVLWVYAALKFPSFRPRTSFLFGAVIAFVAIMGLATIFSIMPYRSFWSNFERMEGYFGLLHLFLYFLLLISVFKSERDWSIFFHTSLGASVLIAFYAIAQLAGRFTIHQGGTRVDATFGNATYLAAYLLFHLFFLIWFFLRTQNFYLRIVYAAAFILESVILYYTATRGAMLGFLGGLIILGALLAILERGLLRRIALSGLGLVLFIPIVFFLFKDADFVKKSDILTRFASISPQETTTQARFTIWGMALEGFRERPILGWGQESFIYVFSKYYEPSLWRQEPWFDRAHNVFLDWLNAGGILGLLGYLSMFGVAGWMLFSAVRAGRIERVSFSIFISLLAAHFFQILFVFDNLTSWLLFFGVLAYINTSTPGPQPLPKPLAPLGARRAKSGAADASGVLPLTGLAPLPSRTSAKAQISSGLALPPALIFGISAAASLGVISVLYFANLKPIFAAKKILDGLKTVQTSEPAGKVDAVTAIFKKGLALNTFGTMETREQISQTAALLGRDQAIAMQDKAKYVEFAIGELEQQRSSFPYDVRAKAFLSTLYSMAGQPAKSLEVVNEALAVNNQRPQFYFIAAEAYLNAGRQEQAISALKRAYDLAADYPEAISNLAVVYILTGKDEEAELLFEKHFTTRFVANEQYAQAYLQAGKFAKAAQIWQALVESNPADARYHAALGVALARSGRPQEGIREIEKAMELEPNFKSDGETIIQGIKSGQIK